MATTTQVIDKNYQLIHEAIDSAEKQMAGLPFTWRELAEFHDCIHDNLRTLVSQATQSQVHAEGIAESVRRLVATVREMESKISELNSEIDQKDRKLAKLRKALED